MADALHPGDPTGRKAIASDYPHRGIVEEMRPPAAIRPAVCYRSIGGVALRRCGAKNGRGTSQARSMRRSQSISRFR
jgi:hypothetical protein